MKKFHLHIVFAFIGLILLILLFVGAPNIGKNVLWIKLAESIAFFVLGLYYGYILIIDIIRYKKESQEYPDAKAETRMETFFRILRYAGFISFLSLIFSILLITVGIIQFNYCMNDFKSGPVDIVLINTSAEYRRSISTRGISTKTYLIEGIDASTGENVRIRLRRFSESAMDAINSDLAKIEMQMYTNTNAIVYMEIHCADKTLVLPDNKWIMHETDTQNDADEDAVENNDKAEPISLEELNLPEYEIGGDYITFKQNMLLNSFEHGFSTQSVTFDNHEYVKAEELEIKEEYQIPENQSIEIYYKDDIQLIVVYEKESFAIMDIFVREK